MTKAVKRLLKILIILPIKKEIEAVFNERQAPPCAY